MINVEEFRTKLKEAKTWEDYENLYNSVMSSTIEEKENKDDKEIID